MKFEGNFGGKFPVAGLDAHSHAQAHVETISHPHAPSDAIIVPDAHLLFTGDFKRSGVDLILSNDDRKLVLHDYFKGEKRAPLASPDGAHLTGDLVNALTGHVEYSQADGSASDGKVIGHVTKLAGTATAVRNGVSIILNQGDNVEKGDVVQSGSGSTLGITFIDGTVFGLSSNARMVLNEMVYDPNGSNNSSLLSLVAGTISFVAGETAKHGDMKIDTPVATMGIRGTAVLVEIDFDVPGQGGTPDAKFQVLVEPDGHTGSYILFEKGTLTPLVTVDKAGQFVSIHNGDVSVGNALMSPDIQKLITDVFALKFTDNTNTNTKTAGLSTDTLTPQSFGLIRLPDGTVAAPFFLNPIQLNNSPPPSTSTGTGSPNQHVDQPPAIHAFGNAATELAGVTGSSVLDTASSIINFVDINPGDAPSVKTAFDSFSYQNAQHIDVTATLNAQQLADIAAVEVKLALVPDPGNNNNGSVTWTYSVADGAFDFLAAGETLTLTYQGRVDNNYAPNDEASVTSFTITITGTNDVPVITTGPESVAYSGGKFTPGGNLPTVGNAPTTGTLSFTDVDLTDTHTVAVQLTDASMSGPGAATLDMAALDALAPAPMAAFEKALSAVVASDSTLTGSGTIGWALADLPVYLADFIPTGEVLTLTYTVTLTDSQQATSTQTITVTITGTDAAAVVWIATTQTGSTGDWNDTANWETGTVPTATDDAIIITDQLQTLTPYYPVTINAAAVAKSLTMNDYGTLFTNSPKLINNSTLTVGAGGVSLSADSIVNNSGTISVAGQMEVLDQSSLQNYGQITLQDGGDFKDNSTITNFGSGTIEVAGGTLNVLVGVANSGSVAIDANATLALNGATITGGIVTNKSGGIVDLTGTAVLKNGSLGNAGQINVSGLGNELYGETVTANHALEVLSGALLIDQGSAVANGGTITVDGTGTLSLNTATISGGTVTNKTGGTIDLTGGGIVKGGSLGNTGQISISGSGNALDTEQVGNNSTLEILSSGALTVDQGSMVTNGTGDKVQIDAGGKLTLNGATVTGGTVLDNGTLALIGSALIQSGVLTNNGVFTVAGSGNALDTEQVGNNSTLEILTGGALTVDQGSVVTNGTGDKVQIDAGGELTLNGATVTGGTVLDNGTLALIGSALIQSGVLTNNSVFTVAGSGNALDTEQVGNNSTLEILTGGALTVDQGSMVTNGTGDKVQIDASGKLTLNGATVTGGTVLDNGTLALIGSALIQSGVLTNNGVFTVAGSGNALDTEQVGNNSTLEVLTGGALTVDQGSVVTNGVGDKVQIDASGKLTLNGATVTGGTVLDNGTLALIGSALIQSGVLTNNSVFTVAGAGNALDTEQVGNNSTLEILSSGALTVDQGSVVTNGVGDKVQVDASGKLTLNGASITGGTVLDNGTLALIGSALIQSGVLTNNGVFTVAGSGNALDTEQVGNNSTLEILTGGALTVDQGSMVTNGTGDKVQIDASGKLTLNGATVTGGTVLDNGTLALIGSALIQSGVLTNNSVFTVAGSGNALDTEQVGNNSTLEILTGGALTVDQGSMVTNGTGDKVQIDASGKLTLNGATVTGGTVLDNGTLALIGSALIQSGVLTNNGVFTVAGSGNALDTEQVGNNSTLEVLTGGALTVDQGSVVTNGTGDKVQIDASGKLTLNGATVTGGTVLDNGTLALIGSALIQSGVLTNNSVFTVAGAGNALDTEQVGNNSTLEILSSGALTVDQGSVVTNGVGDKVQVDASGKLTLNGASITGGTVLDNGTLALIGSALIQSGVLTNNSVFTVAGSGNALDTEQVGNNSTLEVLTGGALTVDQGSVVTNGTGDKVQIDASGKLTLNGATVTGGTVLDNGTLALIGSALIQSGVLTNNSVFTVAGAGNALDTEQVGNNSTLEVLTGGALTVDQGSMVTNGVGDKVQVDASGKLTLNGASITGGTVTNQSGGTIDLAGTGVIQTGSLGNAGTIDVTGSGNALHGETVTANSMLEVMSGGALTIDQTSTVANTATQIDSGGTLTLNAATVTGGTVTNQSGGTIDLTGTGVIQTGSLGNAGTIDVTGSGNALHGETVTANSMLEVKSGGALSIDQTSTVANTTTQVDSGGSLTLNAAIVTGGTVTNQSGGEIDLTGSGVLNGGHLGNSGRIKASGSGNALHNETVTANTELDVLASAALSIDQTSTVANTQTTVDGTLTLNSATINNGTVTVDSGGEIDLTGSGVLNGGHLGNAGAIDVTGSGNALHNETVTANAMLEVKSGGALTIDQTSTVANTTTQVDSGGTLTLNAATVTGGTVTNKAGGTIDLTGTGVIQTGSLGNAGSIDVTGSGNALHGETVTANAMLEVMSGGGLTIDQTSTVANTTTQVDSGGTLTLNAATVTGSTVTNQSGGTIGLTGTAVLKNGSLGNAGQVNVSGIGNELYGETVTANNALEVMSGGALLLDQGTGVTNGGTITIDGTATLTLNGAGITGGTINDYSLGTDGVTVLAGSIDVSGASTITDASLNKGGITIEQGSSLTLSNDMVTGTSIVVDGSINAPIGQLILQNGTTLSSSQLQIDSGDQVTLNGATITGGTVTGSGSIDVTGSSKISGASLNNGGVRVESGKILTLDNVTATGTTFTDPGTIKVESGDSLTLAGTDTITGGEFAIGQGKVALANGGSILLSGVSIGNLKSTDPQVTLTIAATNATNLAIAGGVNGPNGTIVLTGTLSAINAALNSGLTYTPVGTSNTLTMTIDDGLGDTAFRTVTVSTPVSGSPSFQVTNASGAIINASGANGLIDITGTTTLSSDEVFNGSANLKVEANATLKLIHTGTHGGTITDNGTIEVTGESGINGGLLNIGANGVLLVDTGKLLTLNTSTVTSGTVTDNGTIEVTGSSAINGAKLSNGGITVDSGQTLTLDGTTVNGTTFTDTATGAALSLDGGDTLTLQNGASASGGTLSIGSLGVLDIAYGTAGAGATLDHVIVGNSGTVQIDAGTTLTLRDGASIGGGTISDHGTIDATGDSSIGTGTTVNNYATIEATGGTLKIHDAVNNAGTLAANGGTLVVDGDISGAGTATIGGGGTLDLGGADAQTVTFNGLGTLQLEASSNFTGTVSGLATGDVIYLTNTAVASAYFEGPTLVVNGQPTSFQISGVPAGDTFAFESDPSGGTDLKLLPQVLAVGSPSLATGVETQAIQLGFSDSVTGATLSKFVISGIPDGAVISDGTAGHSYTSGSADGSVDVASWNLSSLTITPTNDANFTLSAMVTAVDSNGYDYTLPESESVTVKPTAPTVTWSANGSGIETQIVLGNDLAVAIASQTGDNNTLNTLTISGVPDGATLSDGTLANTITSDGSTPIDVKGWNLSSLTVDTSHATVPDGNFTLTATATEKDGNGDISTTGTASEVVTVHPAAPAVTWTATASGVENAPIVLGNDLAVAIASQTGDNNSLNTLTISGVPDGATLSDGHGNCVISDGSTPIDVKGWTLSNLTVAPTNDANFTLTATATEKDGNGDISLAGTASEVVTVDPAAPAVTWTATASGVENAPIVLGHDLAVAIASQTGDSNTLNTLTISGVPDGATLSDGHISVISDGSPIDVKGWALSSLTVTPTNDANFTLTATATEQDGNGDISAPATASEVVTVAPAAPAVTWTTTASGVENAPIVLGHDLAVAITSQTGDSNTLNTLTISGVPDGAVLSDGTIANTITSNGSTPIDVKGWNLSSLTVDTSHATVPDGNFTLTATATEKDGDAPGDISTTATASEVVTIAPAAPTVTWTATASGVETAPIALGHDLAVAIAGHTGDSNTLNTLTISGVPDGAILSDGTATNTITSDGSTPIDVKGWTLSSLTVDTSHATVPDGNFTLTATATEQDGNGDISTTGTASEHVSVNPTVTLTGLDANHDAVEGTQLVATFDDPNAGSDITYTWTVGGNAVQGATGNTYTPTEADEGQAIRVSVSFHETNGDFKTGSASADTVQESAADQTLSLSGLDANHNAVEGQQITAAVNDPDAGSGITYTWTVGGEKVLGDSGNTYTPTEADEGKTINVSASFTDSHGNVESPSASAGTVQESAADQTLSLSGLDANHNAVEGQQIIAAVNDPDAGSGITYTWTVGGEKVLGDSGNTYTPTEADEGKTINVSASFTDSHGNAETPSASAGTVQTPATAAPIVDLNGTAAGVDDAITTAPDNLQHFVFPSLTISDTGTTIQSAEVTWNGAFSGAITFGGPGFDEHNISIATDSGGFKLTGNDTLADYEDVLSHLTFSTWETQAPTFTVTVNDGTLDSAPATSTVNVVVPGTWDVWTGQGGDGDWNDTANWSLGHAPGSIDVAYVDAVAANVGADTPGPTTISDDLYVAGDQSVTVAQLHILSGTALEINSSSGPSYTFDVTGLPNADGTFSVGLLNDGLIDVANATFELSGNAENTATIKIESGATLALGADLTLEGGGHLVLAGGNVIVPPAPVFNDPMLENVDNTISGTGTIGAGDGLLTLQNDLGGTIDATGGTLTLDTGNAITNNGLLEATNGGQLSVQSAVADSGGTIAAAGGFVDFFMDVSGGTATISAGGTLEYGWTSNVNTTFDGAGTLKLDNQNLGKFSGTVSGFASGDTIDLTTLTYSAAATDIWSQSAGTLTISNGTATDIIHLAGTYTQSEFALAPDNVTGTGTDIVLPASGVAPSISTDNVALVAQTFFGSTGDENATGITYANGELYVVGDNPEGGSSPSAESYVDLFSVNGTTPVWSQAWHYGNFSGIAVDSHEVYAVGVISAGDTSILPPDGDNEDKTLLVSFSANDGTELGFTSHTWNGTSGTTNFFGYKGVESFSDVIATTQAGNTILYAVGTGQPESYDGYIIAEYNSSGTLVNSVTDSLASYSNPGGSSANDVVDWNGALWVVGYNNHPNQGDTYGHATVWTASYDLSSVVMHEDNTGVAASFNSVATIGNELYAVGYANVGTGQQDYLIAEYNADGTVAWNATFGPAGTDTLTGALAVDGHLFVVGSTTNGSSTEGVLMEIDASNGNVISTQTYDAAQYNTFTSITTDGHYLYVAGASGSSAGNDQAVLLTYDIGGTTTTTVEDTAVAMHSLAVSDVAAGSAQIEVTLAVGHGSIALENSSGLASVVYDGTAVELFGSQAAINAVLADGVVYDPASNYTGSDTLTITANDQGHNASGVAQSTTQDVGITVTAADSIADGTTFTVSAPSGDTIAFATGNGTLDLTQPSTFTGEIAGITGTGNVLDLHGFAAATTTASTGSGSFHSMTDTTTLTVTDSSDHQTETFTLAGDLSASTWNVSTDGNGGVDIVDPPAASSSPASAVAAYGPGPATSNTIVASVPNQTLTGGNGSNAFVFNFAGIGHDTVANFHPATDTLQFGGAIFATAQAVLNAIQDDGHGNTVVTLDAHDAITLSGVVKAQLHAADFHFV